MKKKIIVLLILLLLIVPVNAFALVVYKSPSIYYGSWGTGRFFSGTAGGTYYNTWCIEPPLGAPTKNTVYSSAEITGSDFNSVRWYLYYMYDAPGDRAAGHEAFSSVMGSSFNADTAYVVSHMILAKKAGQSWDFGATDTYRSWANGVIDYLDNSYYGGGTYSDPVPDGFHAYLLTNNDGKQAMVSWEYDETPKPSWGYITVPKTNKNGEPLNGIQFALCDDYSTCRDHPDSWYTPSNCDAIDSAAAGSPSGSTCLQVDITGAQGYLGRAYLGYANGQSWLPYMDGDTSTKWLYIREVTDTGRTGDPNIYKTTWDDGTPRIYAMRVSSVDHNIVTDEWLLKKDANDWEYPNGIDYGSDDGSDENVTNEVKYGALRIKKTFKLPSETTGLDGWQFEVYDNSNTLVATLTTGTDGYTSAFGIDSNGKYSLGEGYTYTIKEKVDSEGYAINTDTSRNKKWKPLSASSVVVINKSDLGTVKEVSVQSTTNEKVHFGSFKIVKAFQGDSAKKDGWQFDVYKTTNCNNASSSNYITTLTTGTDASTGIYGMSGSEHTLKLNESYCIKEKIDSDGFADNTNNAYDKLYKPVTVSQLFTLTTPDATTTVTGSGATNRRIKYCYRVKKEDYETHAALSGFSFNMKETSAPSGATAINLNGTTGSDGHYTFNDLRFSNYELVETSSDGNNGYWKDSNDGYVKEVSSSNLTEMTYNASNNTYSCPGNVATKVKKDHKQYRCLKVKKLDTHNNELPGSTFKLGNVEHADSWDGNNDGYVTFFTGSSDSATLRSHTLTEVIAPDEFRRAQQTVTVTEVLLPRELSSSDAEAECKKADGKTSSGTKIINSSGTVNAYNDKYLINWYKERENGANTNNAEFKVYFKDGSTTYYVKAKMNGSNLLTKSWKDKTKNVTKTCNVFDTLTTNASEATTFKSTNTNTNGSASNGEVCIIGFDTDLSAGTSNNRVYTVEETKSLDYHTFGNAKTKNIQVALDYYPEAENVLFKNYKTEFKFTKTVDLTQARDNVDEGSWKNLTTSELKKIPFKVYPSGSNTPLTLVKTADGVYEDSRNNIDKPSGENTDTLYLNNNREIIIYHLPVGNYIIKEERKCCDSTCPNGSCTQSIDQCIGYYHPNDAGVPFEITRCSSPNATSCGSGNYGTVLKTMGNTPTEIEFTKKDFYNEITPNTEVAFADEEERSAFDDIVFNLKDKSDNSVSLVYVGKHITDASNPCMNDNDYSIYRYVRDGETLPSGTTRVTDLHTCGGHIHITNLCRGKDYKMVEVSVPEYSVFQGTSATAQFNIPFSKPNSEGLGGANCCTGGSSRQTNTKATISDLPTKITIWKKNYNPNENIKEDESKKETANFQVYRCPYSVTKCTRAAATYGPIKFEELGKLGNTNEYTYQFKTKQKESGGITTLTLDSNVNEGARLILTYLPANYKYVVVETNAPDGYYNVEGELADVEVIASTVEHDNRSYDKYNYGTRIKFTKKDFYQYYNASDVDKLGSSKKIFDSMTFKLHDKDGNVVNLTEVSAGHYRYIDKNGKHNGTVTDLHTNNGEMLITHLYRNENYYIEETASDTEGDFILPNNVDNSGLGLPSSMNGNKHPILKYEMGNKVPNASDPNEVPDSLTQEIYNDGTRVVFEKRDADTGELIDDNKNTIGVEDQSHNDTITTFNVYRCPKTQSTCTVDNGELVYFEDRTYIKDKNGEDITKDITSVSPPVLAYKYSKENKSQGKVKDLHTDRGVLVIAYLPSKNYKYILYETVAPNGYYQPRKAEAQTPFTVKESSLTTGETYEALTTIVQNEPTKIFFKKDDIYHYYVENDLATESDYNKKIFDSMTFQLRNAEGKVMKFKCSSNEEATGERNADRCETGEYRYIPIDDDNAISELHTLNGEMLITHLYRNETYYLEEIKADTEGNFILPDYFTYDYPLPFDHKGHPVVKYIVPENGPTSQESVTELISNVPSRVVFQKRDSKYNYLIPDELTTFNVYQCDEEVEVCKPENGRIINFEARAEIPGDQEDPGKEVYKYSKLNAGTERTTVDLHPYYGELILRYLPTNHKYVLVETVSPQRYMLPEGENAYTYFTISKTKVDVEEIQVPNKPVSLLLRKYSQDGELLEGAEFKIYETVNKNCNMNKSPEKENLKEALLLKTIRDGVYEVRPAGDTNVFRTCQDRPDMPCNQINRTLTYPEFDTATFGNSMGDFEALVNSRLEKIDIVAGEAIVQYLKYGQCYVIEETKAPKGYSLPEKEKDRFTRIQITDAEQVFDTYEELVNTPTPFTFFKLDEYNKPLDGAKYKLQVLDDNKIYKDVAVTKEEKENGEFYYRVDPESENYIMETKDGKATISYLEEGQYRVLEIEAPEGYELPKKTYNVATFFVDANGKVYGSNIIANKPATEKKMIKPTAKATFIINIVTGQKIIKYGVVIGVIVAIIGGLIIFQKKKISKKDE